MVSLCHFDLKLKTAGPEIQWLVLVSLNLIYVYYHQNGNTAFKRIALEDA